MATSLREAQAEAASESYREEMAALEADEAALHERLKVYDPAAWPAAESVLRHWREHFVEEYIHAVDPDKRLVAQGKCLAMEAVLSGRRDVEAAIRELVKDKERIESQFRLR